MKTAKLVLENGKIFEGSCFAQGRSTFGELIFNTAMCGYEEVLTDPSYCGQMVLMTYPLIGNYGINEEDKQSSKLHLEALIVKEYCDTPSNWRSKKTLKTYLEENNIMGIEGIDTRAITRQLRYVGAMNAYITDSDEPDDVLVQKVKAYAGISGKNLAKEVSTTEVYTWPAPETTVAKVAVIDCGVKFSILDQLRACGCEVTVFPYNTDAETVLSQDFDGILMSNGPGDPSAVTETIAFIKEVLGKKPLFGICLGHQMLCTAVGFRLDKLPFGHHGINHPIKNLYTDKVEISSQNHIYCAMPDSVPEAFNVSHVNLNDNTVAGVRSESLKAFSVQYHPEAAPGPNDSHYLFKEFVYLMQNQCFSSEKQSVTVGEG